MTEILPEIDIKEKLKELKEKGYIKSLRKDNTGIGFTIETLLGIKENNLGEPDFTYKGLPIELKAQRKKAGSRVTLSTKSPVWDPLRDREIIEKLGYIDKKERKALKITLKVDGFNPKGFKINYDEENDRLDIIHKDYGITCYFKYSDLIKSVKIKMFENLLLILAEREHKENGEYFHYTEAILFSKFKEEMFKKLLIDGIVVFEFRMHLKETGAARDRGSGFRISRKYLNLLFEKEEKIL